MIDLEKLNAYLMSEESPEHCMGLSDLDGFLTGILCSPELIMPSEWLPLVWGSDQPEIKDADTHIWAVQEILQLYNEIAAGLNATDPFIEPIFWQAPEGHEIAMDWCEGFMDAFHLRTELWDEFMLSDTGKQWIFPILAHILDDNGNPIIGVEQENLDELLDNCAKDIPRVVPNIFVYWQQRNTPTLKPS